MCVYRRCFIAQSFVTETLSSVPCSSSFSSPLDSCSLYVSRSRQRDKRSARARVQQRIKYHEMSLPAWMDRRKHTDERSTVTGVACWLAVQLFFLLMADGEAHECKTGRKERRMKARESGVREKDRRRKHRLSLNNAAGKERERK